MNSEWMDSVYSDGSRFFVSNSTPKRGESFSISIRVDKNAPIKDIYLASTINGHLKTGKLKKSYIKNDLQYYFIVVKSYEKIFSYQFYIYADNSLYYYNQKGIQKYEIQHTYDFKVLINYDAPNWVKNRVFYQIFPDRFCNGNKEISVYNDEYKLEGYYTQRIEMWDTVPGKYEDTHCLDFYGGDLEGIIQKVPYLKSLGINAIYLTPIFMATSVHRYDCIDYYHVDPHLGKDSILEKLVEVLHRNNIRIVLDISLNHTGALHKWFNKSGEFYDIDTGAYHNPNAKEREYYFFSKEGQNYLGWNKKKNFPVLNYLSNDLKNIMYKSENSIIKKWIKKPYNIDGWRFSAAECTACNNWYDIRHEFWNGVRKSVKQEGYDKYILAEHWNDASEFLQGTEWDGTMNYFGFTRPLRKMLGEVDYYFDKKFKLNDPSIKLQFQVSDFIKQFWDYNAKLPFVVQQNMFNILDGPDLPRLYSNSQISKADYKNAIILMFTVIGVPCIYYGDELEIEGNGETTWESSRFPMPWQKVSQNGEIYKLYSKLCKLKSTSTALIDGGMKLLFFDERILGFARIADDDVIIVVVSFDDNNREIEISYQQLGIKPYKIEYDMLGNRVECKNKKNYISISIPKHSGLVLKI